MESEAVNPAAAPIVATPPPPPAPVVPVAAAPVVPPPQAPASAPTTASHMGWLALSIVLFIIGLLAGSGGGYYLGIQQTSGMFPSQTPTPETSNTVVETETTASDTNPLEDVKLNPFE